MRPIVKDPAFRTSSTVAARWAIIVLLITGLLLLGTFDTPILNGLTTGWQHVLSVLGGRGPIEALQHGVNSGITKRFLPAVVTFAGLTIGTGLLLLRVLLQPTPAQWRLVVRLYAGALATYAIIVLLNKVTGNTVWAYRLSRQLLDFIVSPLPVAGLYLLLRATTPQQQAAA
jgi:hypothetical protein